MAAELLRLLSCQCRLLVIQLCKIISLCVHSTICEVLHCCIHWLLICCATHAACPLYCTCLGVNRWGQCGIDLPDIQHLYTLTNLSLTRPTHFTAVALGKLSVILLAFITGLYYIILAYTAGLQNASSTAHTTFFC
jgi:hypothetical protein